MAVGSCASLLQAERARRLNEQENAESRGSVSSRRNELNLRYSRLITIYVMSLIFVHIDDFIKANDHDGLSYL